MQLYKQDIALSLIIVEHINTFSDNICNTVINHSFPNISSVKHATQGPAPWHPLTGRPFCNWWLVKAGTIAAFKTVPDTFVAFSLFKGHMVVCERNSVSLVKLSFMNK